MPIPLGYSRAVLSGHLRNGEIFQWGFWCSEAPTDAAAANTNAQAIATAYEGLQSTAGTPQHLIDNASGYDHVRVYSYPNGGPRAEFVGEAPITSGVGTGAGDLPNQCCIVATLETGLAGRRHRGRVYLPANAQQLTTGQAASGDPALYASWMVQFIRAVNSAVAPGFVVVLSQVAGSAQRVTAVTVDSRVDIQRRRADREVALHADTESV